MKNEIWKSITNYNGYYEVSNKGRIKSLNRTIFHPRGNLNLKESILKYSKNKNGYHQVVLQKNGDKKSFKIHRLVAIEFVNNPNNLEEVNHKDNDKSNNQDDNIEWTTTRENTCHRSIQSNNGKPIGVSWDKTRNKWSSSIRIGKKRIFLGRFDNLQDAYAARVTYEANNYIINKYL